MGTDSESTTITAIPSPTAASTFLEIAIKVHMPREKCQSEVFYENRLQYQADIVFHQNASLTR